MDGIGASLDQLYSAVKALGSNYEQAIKNKKCLTDRFERTKYELEQFKDIQKTIQCELRKTCLLTEQLNQRRCHLETTLSCKNDAVLKMKDIVNEMGTLNNKLHELKNKIWTSKRANAKLNDCTEELATRVEDKDEVKNHLEDQSKKLHSKLNDLERQRTELCEIREYYRQQEEKIKKGQDEALIKFYEASQRLKLEGKVKTDLTNRVLCLQRCIDITQVELVGEIRKTDTANNILQGVIEYANALQEENAGLKVVNTRAVDEVNEIENCLRQTKTDIKELRKWKWQVSLSLKETKEDILLSKRCQ